MAYTITSQKIVSIVIDSFDADGLQVWHAEESADGTQTEVSVTLDSGEAIVIYVDSVDATEVAEQIDLLANAQ